MIDRDLSRTELTTGAAERLRTLWPGAARVACVCLAVGCLGLFVAAIPTAYDSLMRPPPALQADLEQTSIPADIYAGACLTFDALYVLGSILIAGIIVRRRPVEPTAVFVSLFLITFAGAASSTINALDAGHSEIDALTTILGAVGYIGLNALFYLFPNGRFVPRCTWIIFVLAVVAQVPFSMPNTSPYNPNSWPDPFKLPLLLGIFGMGLYAQIYRYRRVSTPVQRQQTKWVVYGAVAAVVLMFVARSADPGTGWLGRDVPALALVRFPLLDLAFLLIPLTIGFSMLRYRLWDIDVIISRTLLYGGLTGIVVALYILIVGYVGTTLRVGNNLAVSLLATGVVAVLFQPLREQLHRAVNHLVYGARDDPYAVLTDLGKRLESTLAPDAALSTIVETVARALRLPYAAIALNRGDTVSIAAAHGLPGDRTLELPLIYGRESVGRLVLGMRSGENSFSGADRLLLDDLARQAGIAVYAARVTADLRLSREQIVAAREEERRRLRRDLHDGLGPTLGSFNLQLGGVRNMLAGGDIRSADATVANLIGGVETTVGEIRRLVYGLRPPALDELGLAGALRRYATEQERITGGTVQIRVDTVGHIDPLPAAMEVAAFRITQEAMTNVVRHAQAARCSVQLCIDPGCLRVEIEDDGVGFPAARGTGVGLASMRERAEEVGGSLSVDRVMPSGTRVVAKLPFPGSLS